MSHPEQELNQAGKEEREREQNRGRPDLELEEKLTTRYAEHRKRSVGPRAWEQDWGSPSSPRSASPSLEKKACLRTSVCEAHSRGLNPDHFKSRVQSTPHPPRLEPRASRTGSPTLGPTDGARKSQKKGSAAESRSRNDLRSALPLLISSSGSAVRSSFRRTLAATASGGRGGA